MKLSSIKKDLINIAILLILFFTFILLFGFKVGIPYKDIGKELYVPKRIVDGQVLYKDIHWLYGPLAPYFNALLYKIFGIHSDVLRIEGWILWAFIILTAYIVASKLINKILAFLSALSTFLVVATSNFYLLPYSFSTLFSILLSLLFIICFMKQLKTLNKKLLFLMGFIVGMMIGCKYVVGIAALFSVTIFLVIEKIRLSRVEKIKGKTSHTLKPVKGFRIFLFVFIITTALVHSIFFLLVPTDDLLKQFLGEFHFVSYVKRNVYGKLLDTFLLRSFPHTFLPYRLFLSSWIVIIGLVIISSLYFIIRFTLSKGIKNSKERTILFISIFTISLCPQIVGVGIIFSILPIAFLLIFYFIHYLKKRTKLIYYALVIFFTFYSLLICGGRILILKNRTETLTSKYIYFETEPKRYTHLIKISEFIKERTRPDEKIIVFSKHNIIYLLAERDNATRYDYTFYPVFQNSEEELIKILKRDVNIIVLPERGDIFTSSFVDGEKTNLYKYLQENFIWFKRDEWQGNCVLVKKVEETE